MFILTDRKYGEGFVIKEFKGVVAFISAREATNGKIYERWGDIEIGKDKTSHLPVAIRLGDPGEAIKTLEAAAKAIRAGLHDGAAKKASQPAERRNSVAPDIPDDEVPF